jgi:hypothetical protein
MVTRSNDERFERLQRACPACGQAGLRIVYGYPTGNLVEAATRGQLLIGGCTHRAPTHRCPSGHEWHSPDLPDWT